jgi:hypothetical protein
MLEVGLANFYVLFTVLTLFALIIRLILLTVLVFFVRVNSDNPF